MKDPLVSIIMSVYNGESFIAPSVESILKQSYQNFDFIVVDDGSTDRTAIILKSFSDPRLKILTNEKNVGQTRSLNLGLKVAQGKYIARQDADDISKPDRLGLQIEFMEQYGNVGLLGTDYEIVD
jgi:glycosyltransferase involved in cell wall biosynthesis